MTRPGLLFQRDGLQDLGHRQRLDALVGLDQDAAVGAHGQPGAQRFGRLLRADRDDDDFARLAGLLQPQRLFHRDLVERVHRHLDVRQLDAGPVRLHPDLHVVVNNPLHGDENFHVCTTPIRPNIQMTRIALKVRSSAYAFAAAGPFYPFAQFEASCCSTSKSRLKRNGALFPGEMRFVFFLKGTR